MTTEEVPVDPPAPPVMPMPPTAIVVGRICALGHPRISHREEVCPLCVCRQQKSLLEQHAVLVAEQFQILSGEKAMLYNKLFEMRQTMIELGHVQR